MKKQSFCLSILLLLTGCGQHSQNDGIEQEDEEFEILKDDIVLGGKSVNRERLDVFIQHVNEGTPDEVRVIHYTIEGDPIIDGLRFDGNKITETHDTRWDKYGAPSVTKRTCHSIEWKEEENWITYELLGCP